MCRDDEEAFGDGAYLRLPGSTGGGCGTEYRRRLLLSNRERIEFSYEKARSQGLEGPVILVLDLFDERAAHMSQMAGASWERIERSRQECRQSGVVPVQVVAVPPSSALCLVGPSSPMSACGVAAPCPPDAFRVIAIAAGGNSFADFPLPPVSSCNE